MHGSLDRKDQRPPEAARRPQVASHHGVERKMTAFGLSENWHDARCRCSMPRSRAYLEAENAYCEGELADTRLQRRSSRR